MSVTWWDNTPFNTPDPLTAHIERPGASTWTLPDYQGNPWLTQTPDVGWEQFDYRTGPNRSTAWYDNVPRGTIFDSLSTLGNRTITNDINQWLEQTFPDYFTFPRGDVPYQTGDLNSLGGEWANVDRWNGEVLQAVNAVYQQTGVYVPPNLIKAIMFLESGGVNLARNGAGAIGLMQVVDTYWGNLGFDLYDPAQNIMAGATVLVQMYNQYQAWAQQSGIDPWKAATYSYYAGNPYNLSARDDPAQGGSGMTTGEYGDQIWANFQRLNAGAGTGGPGAVGGGAGGSGSTQSGTASWLVMTGGIEFPITQGLGGNAMDYSNYDYTLGVTGHPAIDIGTPLDTRAYSPVHGTVVTTGGSQYFADERYGAQVGSGELKIKLDNGDELILGHMGSISVNVGDRVIPGQFVGLSGTYNGPHIHAEYRRYQPHQYGTHIAVDPRLALDGIFTGTYTQTPGLGQSPFVPSPSDWSAFMRQAAMGGTLPGPGYEPYFGGSQWSHWLRNNAAWIPQA